VKRNYISTFPTSPEGDGRLGIIFLQVSTEERLQFCCC